MKGKSWEDRDRNVTVYEGEAVGGPRCGRSICGISKDIHIARVGGIDRYRWDDDAKVFRYIPPDGTGVS